MNVIASILLFLLITACGGSGSTDKEKYNTSNYKDLAGTWTPWISESDYEDYNGAFEIIFSRFGSVYLYANINDISINCFGNYDINGFRQDSSLNCNTTDTNNEFFDFNFSSVFDNEMMMIDTVELSNLLLISEFDNEMTLYKSPVFWMDAETNIKPGTYDISEINNILIRISSNGQIETIRNGDFLNVDCEINGSIKTDPDYGLTTQNQVNALFVDSHEATIDVKNCYMQGDNYFFSSKADINQIDQVSILRAGYWENDESYDFIIDLTASGNKSINGGNNSFYLSLIQVCDELGIPTDYAVNNYDYNYCEDYN